jgi:hypothetical protein
MSQQDIADALIEKQGTLFSEEMGINLAKDTPETTFAWLTGTILLAKRISHDLATRAGKALNEAGLMRVDAVLEADESTLIDTLGENGYKRYRKVATDYIRETAAWVRDRFDGDLNRLPKEAGSAEEALELVQSAKGVGEIGAEIFAREAQLNWDMLYPRLDGAAAEAADRLGLTCDHGALVSLAGSRERFVRLAVALSRATIDEPANAVSAAAEG